MKGRGARAPFGPAHYRRSAPCALQPLRGWGPPDEARLRWLGARKALYGPGMSDSSDVRRYLENWQDEVDSASEYRAMAASEPDPRLTKVYANLAAMEEGHIEFWEDRLRRAGAKVPPRRATWRSRVLAAIARRLGPDLVLATIAAKEAVDQNGYVKQPETAGTAMPGHERWHARVLQQLVSTQPGHGRRRRVDRQSRDPRDGSGRAPGGGRLDGARRVGVGDELTRARAARDPHRGERAPGRSRGRR